MAGIFPKIININNDSNITKNTGKLQDFNAFSRLTAFLRKTHTRKKEAQYISRAIILTRSVLVLLKINVLMIL